MQSILRFYKHAAKLKTLRRAGWKRCGMTQCESVADHTFGVAMLALALPTEMRAKLDHDRCIKLALVHDLAESIIGDITPHDGIDPADKRRREEAAMRQLASDLGNVDILDLWLEFENGTTPESRLARDLDVIEMAWQARAYEKSGSLAPENAAQFIQAARRRIQTDEGTDLLALILAQ